MFKLGTLIRRIRTALDINQRDFSKLIGVSQATLSQYETGDAAPSFQASIRILNNAPPGDLKSAFREALIADFRSDYPEHPELAEGVIQDVAASEALLAQLPTTKSARHAKQLERLAALVGRIAANIDDAVLDFLDEWFMYGSGETAPIFRNAVEYVRTRLYFLAGTQPDEPAGDELMRERAKAARRLAIALLRQADAAEEHAIAVHRPRRPSPQRKGKKKDDTDHGRESHQESGAK